MRLLLVTPFLPYPGATSGAPRAIYDRVRLLSAAHRVTVVTLVQPGEQPHLQALRALGVEVYAVPVHTGGETSTLQKWEKRARLVIGLLRGRPMLVQEFASERVCRLLARLTRRTRFDVVLVEHILAAHYSACLRGDPPLILTDHDVRAAFPEERGPAAGAGGLLTLPLHVLDRLLWRRYALAAYLRAALVSVPTEEDARLVRANVPGLQTSVRVVPFGLAPVATLTGHVREDNALLFVGNFDHPPNRDAAMWLRQEIMPLVWARRPDVELWLVGRNPTPEVRALAGARVTVTGEVPSVQQYLQRATLFVAPIRLGGGVRMKVLEALAAGTPVVSTPLGARGIGAVPGVHLLLAASARDFARVVVRALDDPGLRERLSRAGQQLASGAEQDDARRARLTSLLEEAVDIGPGGRSRGR